MHNSSPDSQAPNAINSSTLAGLAPLGDPLRTARRYLFRFIAIGTVAAIIAGLLGSFLNSGERQGVGGVFVVVAYVLVWLLPTLLYFALFLPRREVNCLYLRSFKNDPRSWPIRKATQEALGTQFRLSGIRDPRRRRSLLDYLAFTIFVLRYSTPKYMNLEAGGDWKARLWRSLAHVRCVVIDISELTPFLLKEVELCFHTLAANRILLIAEEDTLASDWREQLAPMIPGGLAAVDAAPIALWRDSSRASRRKFADSVRAFAQQLPAGAAEPKEDSRTAELLGDQGLASDTAAMHDKSFWLPYVFVILGSALAPFALRAIDPDLSEQLGNGVMFVICMVVLWYFLSYILDTTRRRRFWAISGLVLPFTPLLLLVPDIVSARAAAQHNSCRNNLHQIGMAVWSFETTRRCIPPAYTVDQAGKPLLSWRVHLLPYMEQDTLYKRFHLEEPWDSPHNRELIAEMPKEFLCPSSGHDKNEGLTNYLGVVGREYCFREPSAPWGLARSSLQTYRAEDSLRRGLQRAAIRDGISSTIAVLEVNDERSVVWTKPEDWKFDPAAPPQDLGGMHQQQFLVLFADSNVGALPVDIEPSELKALLTTSGGEHVFRP